MSAAPATAGRPRPLVLVVIDGFGIGRRPGDDAIAQARMPNWRGLLERWPHALEHLRRAHAIVLFEEPPELLALELRGALDELGEMVGAVYTDDLLDRIFSRFCIGK